MLQLARGLAFTTDHHLHPPHLPCFSRGKAPTVQDSSVSTDHSALVLGHSCTLGTTPEETRSQKPGQILEVFSDHSNGARMDKGTDERQSWKPSVLQLFLSHHPGAEYPLHTSLMSQSQRQHTCSCASAISTCYANQLFSCVFYLTSHALPRNWNPAFLNSSYILIM